MTETAQTNDIAMSATLSLEQLTETVDDLAPHLEFLWVVRPSSAELLRFLPGVALEQCDSGRGFGALCELRWMRHDNLFRTMVTSAGPRPRGTWPHVLDLAATCVARRARYRLLGERDEQGDGWYASNVPHRLVYPVAEPWRRVHLDVVLYHDVATSALTLSRFAGMRGDPE